MNVPLIVAGSLAILGAAIHGVGGEVLVVRKLSPGMLPSSRFGGPGMTRAMIHVTWHIATIAFLTVGSALLLAGSVLDGNAARGIALVAAADGTTNALALASRELFAPLYGPGSEERFREHAVAQGVEYVAATIPNLAADVDTLADLDRLELPVGPRTLSVLSRPRGKALR